MSCHLREKSHHHVGGSELNFICGRGNEFCQVQEGDAESGADGENVGFYMESLTSFFFFFLKFCHSLHEVEQIKKKRGSHFTQGLHVVAVC